VNSETVESDVQGEIRLRVVVPDDEPFLLEVYKGVRGAELAALGWNAAQQELFLKMQLKARDQSYPMYYPGLDDRIILFKDKVAGRLIVSRTDDEIRLVDISLLPDYRNARIGTSVITDLLREADRTHRLVRLQVERTNDGARRLYERLGFTVTGENQTHFQMERGLEH
jgi:ribosomal protein S18 acetylase RimI-like enzyme